MTSTTPPRVKLNLRVDESVKRRFEDALLEEYPSKRPYAGVMLEKELKATTGDGRLSDLLDVAESLADTFGEVDREKKFSQSDRGETEIVAYRVDKRTKTAVENMAARSDGVSHAGEIVERVMWNYAHDRGVIDRVIDRLERVKATAEIERDDDRTAVERRTDKLVAALTDDDDGCYFTIDDFDDAAESETTLNVSRHTRRKYLPRVLEATDITWVNNREFGKQGVNYDPPDPRDVSKKPKWLRDDADLRTALKIVALRKAAGRRGTFTVSELLADIHGRPQQRAKEQLEQIAECDGFSVREKDGTEALGVISKDALNDDKNDHAARVVRGDHWNESATPPQPSPWPQTAGCRSRTPGRPTSTLGVTRPNPPDRIRTHPLSGSSTC